LTTNQGGLRERVALRLSVGHPLAPCLASRSCSPPRWSRAPPATPIDGGVRVDAGDQLDIGDGCPPQRTPPPVRGCAEPTWRCIRMATDETDLARCLAADPTPEACDACVHAEVLWSCTGLACGVAYGNLQCCLALACPSGEPACLEAAPIGPCDSYRVRLGECLIAEQNAGLCGVSPDVCFFAPDAGI
jgi:hypothetical protein